MPERVPAGVATNAGQPIAGRGAPAAELEYGVNAVGLNPPVAIAGEGAPAAE